MTEQLASAALRVFQYPTSPRVRRHGPSGYANYKSYKPWLRDEFQFRCVYCLCRERWEPNGHHVFGTEHILSQSAHPELSDHYDNLVYACLTCNGLRQDRVLPFDPCRVPTGEHLRVSWDGWVEPLTDAGDELREIVRLNRPTLVQYRQRIISLVALLGQRGSSNDERVMRDLLGYPNDLPNLALRRPPRGNSRPDGVAHSYFEQRSRGVLPPIY